MSRRLRRRRSTEEAVDSALKILALISEDSMYNEHVWIRKPSLRVLGIFLTIPRELYELVVSVVTEQTVASALP